MSEEKSLAIIQESDEQSPLSAAKFAGAMEIASQLAQSDLVPKDYKGKPANVLIAMETGHSLGLSPIMTMNNLHIISGRPVWSTAFQIGLVNQRAGLQQKIDWNVTQPDEARKQPLTVTCFAIRKDGAYVDESIDWTRVKAEGWDKKDKYRTMPIIMMKYRAAAALIRLHWPELLLGYYTDADVEIETEKRKAPDVGDLDDLPAAPVSAEVTK